MKKVWYLTLALMFMLSSGVSFARMEKEGTGSLERHLEVTPPEGWFKSPPMDKGLFDACTAYARQDESVLLLACPAAENQKTFADVLADEKKHEESISIGGSVLQPGEGMLSLFVPLKDGSDGAMFLIMGGSPLNQGLLHRARPMLAEFKDFAVPTELLGPDINPLHYAGKFSFHESKPVPELDGLTLAQHNGKDENGKQRYILAAILPHFPLWLDLPQRLGWLGYFFGPLVPEGKHWKSIDAPHTMACHVARSRDGKALVILRGIPDDDPVKLKHYQQMFDKFEW